MSATAIIAFAITVASFLLGIIYKVISLSVTIGRLLKTVEENERKDCEERASASRKFAELFEHRNKHDKALALMDMKISTISEDTKKINAKLDHILGHIQNKQN